LIVFTSKNKDLAAVMNIFFSQQSVSC